MEKKSNFFHEWITFAQDYPHYILMVRVGSFYEFYGQDAEKISPLLNIKLRHVRRYGDDLHTCGFPVKSLEKFLPLILQKGLCLAQCEEEKIPKNINSSSEEYPSKKSKNKPKRYVFRLFQPQCYENIQPVSYLGIANSPVLKAHQITLEK